MSRDSSDRVNMICDKLEKANRSISEAMSELQGCIPGNGSDIERDLRFASDVVVAVRQVLLGMVVDVSGISEAIHGSGAIPSSVPVSVPVPTGPLASSVNTLS